MDYDAIYDVLLHSNASVLANLCNINTNSRNICNNEYFWRQKFNYYNYPLITKTVPINGTQWLAEYTLVEKSINEAYDILMVALISHKNREFNTNMIQFNALNSLYNDINDIYYLHGPLIEKYEIEVENNEAEDDEINPVSINIKIVQDNDFEIVYTAYDYELDRNFAVSTNVDYNHAMDIIIRILYDHYYAISIGKKSYMYISDDIQGLCRYFMTDAELNSANYNPSYTPACTSRIEARNKILNNLHS